MKTRLPFALSALLLIGLAACDRSEPAPAPEPESFNEPVAEEALPEPEPAPPPEAPRIEPETVNSAEEISAVPPPPEPTPPSEQMLEDAEATGMTARVHRGDTEPTEKDGEAKDGNR